ncbi:transporter substrate-binding domain-containing protein [Nocardia lijiangensis]|uniref:transporter substrate-binding domain-containing protein n=1 Tax=Nocardia lijiangensis TaxID=299618 RepID=UPI00082E9655|nr:transporter substrate-binding domain-containing protein [Nocardia lijiangensis]
MLITPTLLPVGCGTDNQPSLFTQKRLVVGVKNDQPGTSVWETYKRTGFDILVAYHVANAEGVARNKVVYNDIASSDRVQALLDDRVDLVIATFSITRERMEQIDFAGPYAVTHQGFLVRGDGPEVKTINDLNDKTVCTWKGTTSEIVLGNYKNIHTQVMEDAQTCISALANGTVDAASTDQLILYGFAQQNPTLEVADVTIGAPNYYGIGISKEHRADCRKLRDALFNYVTSSDWQRDFTEVFQGLAGRWIDFRPQVHDIDSWSCKDKPPS